MKITVNIDDQEMIEAAKEIAIQRIAVDHRMEHEVLLCPVGRHRTAVGSVEALPEVAVATAVVPLRTVNLLVGTVVEQQFTYFHAVARAFCRRLVTCTLLSSGWPVTICRK